MKTSWFKLVSAAIVMGALTFVGCGQKSATAPSDAATPKDATKEMQERETEEMGDVNMDAPKAKEKPATESGDAPAEEAEEK